MQKVEWKNPTIIGATIGAVAVILAAIITMWGGNTETHIEQRGGNGSILVGGSVEGKIHSEKSE